MRDVDSVDRERLFSEVEGSSTIVQKLKVMGKKIMTGGNTFFKQQAVNLWNALPVRVVEVYLIVTFKLQQCLTERKIAGLEGTVGE